VFGQSSSVVRQQHAAWDTNFQVRESSFVSFVIFCKSFRIEQKQTKQTKCGIDAANHLETHARRCRSGGGNGAGQAENSLSNPTAPRRLADFGVNTMLFLPSRMCRTSTIPPRDKPETSRHHFSNVHCPTLETVMV
jgi:hypothetical protein